MEAFVGEVTVSSDHLLRSGSDVTVDDVEDWDRLLLEVLDPPEMARNGTRPPERYELTLSLRDRLPSDTTSFRGLVEPADDRCADVRKPMLSVWRM